MVWSRLLSGRVTSCARTAMCPLGVGGAMSEHPDHLHLPVCVWNHGEGLFDPGSDQLGPEPVRGERGRHTGPPIRLSASLFPEEISLTVPSSWQAEEEGGRNREEVRVCVCVWDCGSVRVCVCGIVGVCVCVSEREREKEGGGNVTASLGKREI